MTDGTTAAFEDLGRPQIQPRRRFRVRLSLRAVMVLIMVLGVGLGWVVHRAREQRLAVEAILSRGGWVVYDYQYDTARNRLLPQGRSWRPLWLRSALGDEYFHNVVSAGLEDIAADEDLADFARLGHLKLLYLGGGRVTDAGLERLNGLTDLRVLILWGNPIRGEGLRHLRGLKGLQQLNLAQTQVTDDGLRGLGDLTGLERLNVPSNPQLTGAFLQHVADLPDLKDLVLGGSGITDASLSHLEHAQNVQSLMLDHTKVTDVGLFHLRGLASLRSLDLSETAVTDEGVGRVRGWFPLAGVKPWIPLVPEAR